MADIWLLIARSFNYFKVRYQLERDVAMLVEAEAEEEEKEEKEEKES